MLKTPSVALSALAVAAFAGSAFAQTFAITPGGTGLGSVPVFRYTPPAGVINPTVAALTSSTSVHATYSFSPNGVATTADSLWKAGWFFRVQGENREYAFINAASHTANNITVTRNAVVGNNIGTADSAEINYTVERTTIGGYRFTSKQTWQIVNAPAGPLVIIRNFIQNTGTVTIPLNLYWVADLDTPSGAFDDVLSVVTTPFDGLRQTNASGSGTVLFMPRGNATAYLGRGGVGFPASTTVFEEMADVLASPFNNSILAAAGGFDRTYGYQWTAEIPVGGGLLAETGIQIQPIVPCGPSDVAGANQSIGSDGQLTADDIIVFLAWYFANDPRANIAGPNQSTTPDAALTADDVIVFLGRYFAGC